MTQPTPFPPPWKLEVPTGGRPGTAEQVRKSIVNLGQYDVTDAPPYWMVRRVAEPSAYLVRLQWQMTRGGLIGSVAALDQHVGTWPAASLGQPAAGAAALASLRNQPKPDSPIELLGAFRRAELIINSATPSLLAQYASGVAHVLLGWYPRGQMLAWGKSNRYVMEGRPAHMLAGAALNDWAAVEEGLTTGRGGVWFRGEDISSSHPGALYLNLLSSSDLPGIALDTTPVTFIFEFGVNLSIDPPLDFLSVRYLHSLPVVDYLPANLPASSGVVQPGVLEQDAVREWFLSGFNRLADHLIRWENYMTRSGVLRPVVLQETNMTVARILNVTAHLLASEERGSRLADFWDLVDLYGRLHGNDIPRIFSNKYWEERVVAALSTLPGNHGPLFVDYARALYREWLEQTVAGVTTPSRITSASVRVTYETGDRDLPHDEFFGRHIQVRRNTLHGYDLRDPVDRAFLSIHDGSLAVRLPEWGRLMLLALLAYPVKIIERRFLSDSLSRATENAPG